MQDPYDEIEWSSVHRLHSINHEHTFGANRDGWAWGNENEPGPRRRFQTLYDRGIRHFALSNYYPSKPTYPLRAFFSDVPADAIGCPNAEHATPTGHFCSVGSTFATHPETYDGSWGELFDDILGALQFPNGGGVVINHPRRSDIGFETSRELLAYDPRVLGIEVWNHRGVVLPKYRARGNATALWDELLSAGIHTFGFFNPDYHRAWDCPRAGSLARGRNILLVDETTEEAAGRAYREGRFYGALDGSGLAFERIETTGRTVTIETNQPAAIQFISRGETLRTTWSTATAYTIEDVYPYVRIEAHDDTGERIFSQPIVTETSSAC